MRVEPSRLSETTQIKAVTAARVKNDLVGRCGHHVANGAQERRRHAKVMQPPPSGEGGRRVSRLL